MFQISDLAHPTGRVDASKAYPVQAPLHELAENTDPRAGFWPKSGS